MGSHGTIAEMYPGDVSRNVPHVVAPQRPGRPPQKGWILCLDAQQQPCRLDASAGQYNQRSANNRRLIAGPHLDSGNFAAPGVEMQPRGGASEADPQVRRRLELCPVTLPHIRLSGKSDDAAAAKSASRRIFP